MELQTGFSLQCVILMQFNNCSDWDLLMKEELVVLYSSPGVILTSPAKNAGERHF